jgi:hypothetical protein
MIRAKIVVSAVKIKNYLFILFILNYFKIANALKLECVRCQELLPNIKIQGGNNQGDKEEKFPFIFI